MRLMGGLGTYNTFPLVTEAKTWISKNVEIRLGTSAEINTDYIASYLHRSQFSTSVGAELVDGVAYKNNFVARSGQMVAPVQCYLKSVIGWINTSGCSGVEEEFYIVISIWKKPTTDAGTANTAVTLLFSQTFDSLAGATNSYCEKIDGTTDVKVGDNTYTVDAGEGIMASIKWVEAEGETARCSINANFEMTFETLVSETTTTEDIALPTLSTDVFMGYNETLNAPNRAIRNRGGIDGLGRLT